MTFVIQRLHDRTQFKVKKVYHYNKMITLLQINLNSSLTRQTNFACIFELLFLDLFNRNSSYLDLLDFKASVIVKENQSISLNDLNIDKKDKSSYMNENLKDFHKYSHFATNDYSQFLFIKLSDILILHYVPIIQERKINDSANFLKNQYNKLWEKLMIHVKMKNFFSNFNKINFSFTPVPALPEFNVSDVMFCSLNQFNKVIVDFSLHQKFVSSNESNSSYLTTKQKPKKNNKNEFKIKI